MSQYTQTGVRSSVLLETRSGSLRGPLRARQTSRYAGRRRSKLPPPAAEGLEAPPSASEIRPDTLTPPLTFHAFCGILFTAERSPP